MMCWLQLWFRAGFVNLRIIAILNQRILDEGCSLHCKVFGNIFGFYTLDASSNSFICPAS